MFDPSFTLVHSGKDIVLFIGINGLVILLSIVHFSHHFDGHSQLLVTLHHEIGSVMNQLLFVLGDCIALWFDDDIDLVVITDSSNPIHDRSELF